MNNKKHSIIITTTDDKKVATSIAKALLEAKLAACVQINNIDSLFLWNGELKKIKEFRLLIKTQDSHYNEVEKFILNNHNYDLPQIIKLDIVDGLSSYLEWVEKETSRYKA